MTDYLTLQSRRDLYTPQSKRGHQSEFGALSIAFMNYRLPGISSHYLLVIRCGADDLAVSRHRNMK
jgi:hypothetical protein